MLCLRVWLLPTKHDWSALRFQLTSQFWFPLCHIVERKPAVSAKMQKNPKNKKAFRFTEEMGWMWEERCQRKKSSLFRWVLVKEIIWDQFWICWGKSLSLWLCVCLCVCIGIYINKMTFNSIPIHMCVNAYTHVYTYVYPHYAEII